MPISLRTAVLVKYLGLWFIVLAGLLVYGETAPTNPDPEFMMTAIVLPIGVALYYGGCCGIRRALNQRGLE